MSLEHSLPLICVLTAHIVTILILPCNDSQEPYHSLSTVHKFTLLFLRVLPISFSISACLPFHLSACNGFLGNLVLKSYNKMCGRISKLLEIGPK